MRRRLGNENASVVSFQWNGKTIAARSGDSVAVALYAHGIRTTGWTRKFHRPQGLSGLVFGGLLARVDGVPNVRLDEVVVSPGLCVKMQNCWPTPSFNLLRLARFLPPSFLKGGFEHSSLIPSGTKAFQLWERFLGFMAGVAEPATRSTTPSAAIEGTAVVAIHLVIGGGPSGCRIANELAAKGSDVVLVSRGDRPARHALTWGEKPPAVDPKVRTLWGVDIFGAYRDGSLLLGSPRNDRAGVLAIRAENVVLATGKRTLPPLMPGAWLPGVMDERTALDLAFNYSVPPGEQVLVVGRGREQALADRLKALGVSVAGVMPVTQLKKIRGRSHVTGVDTHGWGRIKCDALVFFDPSVTDRSLLFQSGSKGELQLTEGKSTFTVADSSSETAVPNGVMPEKSHESLVCPCMDVSTQDVADLVDAGQRDLEVIKRLTACGMGPCQGTPCWQSLKQCVSAYSGGNPTLPTQRPPRRAMTVAQAAGLVDLVEPLK